jgi:hypothetical protein
VRPWYSRKNQMLRPPTVSGRYHLTSQIVKAFHLCSSHIRYGVSIAEAIVVVTIGRFLWKYICAEQKKGRFTCRDLAQYDYTGKCIRINPA